MLLGPKQDMQVWGEDREGRCLSKKEQHVWMSPDRWPGSCQCHEKEFTDREGDEATAFYGKQKYSLESESTHSDRRAGPTLWVWRIYLDLTKGWSIHNPRWSLRGKKVVSQNQGDTPFLAMFGFYGTVMRQMHDGYSLNRNANLL